MTDVAPRRVLFVDDESRVLDGLRRSLRAQRGRWTMSFAVGGTAALEELERGTFDVIVSDMRMPDIDGFTLLTAVRDRWPRMARIVLSGYSDREAAVRSTSVAHQFLAKPSDPAELEAIVERTCRLTELLADERLRMVVGEGSAFARPPRVYAEIERLLADPSANFGDVSSVIEGDVVLAAEVLRLANAPLFGGRQPVGTVAEAIARAGVNVIRALVLSHELAELARAAAPHDCVSAHQEHALRTAHLARTIARGGALAEDAFVAGMLHDVGALLLASERADWLPRASVLAAERGVSVHEAELALFGVTHAEVGALVVAHWNLPFRIVEAVAYHHSPSRSGETSVVDLVAAVHVAAALVSSAAPASESPCGPAVALDAAYVESLGVGPQLEPWRASAAREQR